MQHENNSIFILTLYLVCNLTGFRLNWCDTVNHYPASGNGVCLCEQCRPMQFDHGLHALFVYQSGNV